MRASLTNLDGQANWSSNGPPLRTTITGSSGRSQCWRCSCSLPVRAAPSSTQVVTPWRQHGGFPFRDTRPAGPRHQHILITGNAFMGSQLFNQGTSLRIPAVDLCLRYFVITLWLVFEQWFPLAMLNCALFYISPWLDVCDRAGTYCCSLPPDFVDDAFNKVGSQLHKTENKFRSFHDIAQFRADCWLTARSSVNSMPEFL